MVPSIHFKLLYVWFVIDHGRRRVLHFNVVAHPRASWVIQQLRKAFPDAPTHRYLIFDNDSICSPDVELSISRFGIHPRRTALQSPWQNGTAERIHTFIGDAPEGRDVQDQPSDQAKVIGLPRVGGLHHQYVWAEAA